LISFAVAEAPRLLAAAWRLRGCPQR